MPLHRPRPQLLLKPFQDLRLHQIKDTKMSS